MIPHKLTDAFDRLFPELKSQVVRYVMPTSGKRVTYFLKDGTVLNFVYSDSKNWKLETSV